MPPLKLNLSRAFSLRKDINGLDRGSKLRISWTNGLELINWTNILQLMLWRCRSRWGWMLRRTLDMTVFSPDMEPGYIHESEGGISRTIESFGRSYTPLPDNNAYHGAFSDCHAGSKICRTLWRCWYDGHAYCLETIPWYVLFGKKNSNFQLICKQDFYRIDRTAHLPNKHRSDRILFQ